MKIVIDIPEERYEFIKGLDNTCYDIHAAIAQGIPYEEKPIGEWIVDEEKGINSLVTCPFCNERHCCVMNYCGNCRAEMRKEEGK